MDGLAKAETINKSMDRADLFSKGAQPIIADLNALILQLYARGLRMSSWYGSLPGSSAEKRTFIDRLLWRRPFVGRQNRGRDYVALPEAADDRRIPWYLYWEITWVLTKGPPLTSKARLLDAGGAASLLSCYLASLGHELHSIDLNPELVANAQQVALIMGWAMRASVMNMAALDFPAEFFDHAYSICVFEHLTYDTKQAALREIARVLKPGGILSITFDLRNPAPALAGIGPSTRLEDQLNNWDDIQRNFLSTGMYKLLGNPLFEDNGASYLVDPERNDTPYSFGAIFLQKLDAM